MKVCVLTILVLAAAAISLGLANPASNPRGRNAVNNWNPNSAYFAQRLGQVEPLSEELESVEDRARKYTVKPKKSTKQNQAAVVEDEPEDEEEQDDDEEDTDNEDEEQDDEAKEAKEEEELLDLPPWERLFPEKENLPKDQIGSGNTGYNSGPPPEDDLGGYGEGPPPQGYRRIQFDDDWYPSPPPRQRRYRSQLPWDNEPEYYPQSRGRSIRPRNYRFYKPIVSNRVDRTGKQVRIITGWSDTVLQDNYNPEYIVNPTLMRLRRRRRYHPSQAVPLQKIPLRGYYGNPRDTYINPYGGQRWTTGPFEPHIYSHGHRL